jgi:alcohol dehydrogenase class IV
LSSLASRFQVVRFSDFTANPTIKEVEEAIGLVRDTNCDAVVAIGGGTALDIGKSAAIFATQDQGSVSYLRTNLPLRPRNCLLVLVPTTAGSGSEVTSFCTIYVDGIKKSLDDPLVLADYVIADPNLLTHLPPRIAASAALDALCQAIESFWSVRSTWRSRQLAAQALRLTLAHLKTFCSKPTSNDRTAMARAAILAGKAINITRTTAPHAVSYAPTSVFGVPHGHACALTLPGFLRYNAMVTDLDVADSRGVRWVRRRIAEIIHMLGATDYEEACLRLHELIRSSGLEPRLSLLGLGSAEIVRLLNCGFDLQRADNNPRRLTTDGLREVLTLSL